MAQPYRFRPAFGQVGSLFRGARAATYPFFPRVLIFDDGGIKTALTYDDSGTETALTI